MPLEIVENKTRLNHLDEQSTWLRGELVSIMEKLAVMLYTAMDQQFETEGRAFSFWLPLSPITIALKAARRAPEPDRILKEWGTLRDSLDANDESDDESIKYCVGVFDYETTGLYLPNKSPAPTHAGRPKEKWKTVSRAYIHEFGGWELQDKRRDMMEEVLTRHLNYAAARGFSFLAKADWEVRKKIADRNKDPGKIVYIPRRSFIADPFDAIVDVIWDIMSQEVADLFEFLDTVPMDDLYGPGWF